MANLGQLKTAVGRKFNMDTTASTDDSNALIDWANEAVVDVLLRTDCYVVCGDMTLSSGTTDYRLDALILKVFDIHITGSGNRKFEPVTFQELLDRRNNNSNTGNVSYYAIQGDMILVHPNPSTTTNVHIYYIPRPTAMVNNTDDPTTLTYGGVPSEYHKAIEAYMMWQAAEFQGDFSGVQEQQYERRIQRIKIATNRKGGKNPRAKLAPIRQSVPSDPSVDLR